MITLLFWLSSLPEASLWSHLLQSYDSAHRMVPGHFVLDYIHYHTFCPHTHTLTLGWIGWACTASSEHNNIPVYMHMCSAVITSAFIKQLLMDIKYNNEWWYGIVTYLFMFLDYFLQTTITDITMATTTVTTTRTTEQLPQPQ